MSNPGLYQAIFQLAVDIMKGSANVKHILGKDLIDLPGSLISVNSLSAKTNDGTIYKINLPTRQALAAFEWKAEVMIDNRQQEILKHYLLKDDFEIVEAYGTKVFPAEDPQGLKQHLSNLKAELKPHFVSPNESRFVE